MKIPFWKIWLSHFFNLRIEKVKSSYSGSLEVVLSRGRLALCTDNAMYSFEDLYINFRESFSRIRPEDYNINKVLILGAGMLSVPLILEKIHHRKYSYKAVEIDPAVLKLAEKYALSKLESHVELICADALDFVNRDNNKYGLIIVDLFIDDEVPAAFENVEFLKKIQALLEPDGLLFFNRMAQHDAALKKTEAYYDQIFKTVFVDAQMLNLNGNCMLVARAL